MTIMYFGIFFPYLFLKTKVPGFWGFFVFYLSANKNKKLVLKTMFILYELQCKWIIIDTFVESVFYQIIF